MELLKSQAPFLYWLIHTLWQFFVAASTSLLIFLCIALVVYLFNRAQAC